MVKGKVLPSTVKKNSKKTVSAPKTKITNKPTPTTPKIPLTREQIEESIRLKAYELYLLRMGQDGSAEDDWLIAEKLILQS